MIQTKKIKALCEAEIVDDVICNVCGGSCKPSAGAHNYEYATLRAVWGYDSDGRDGDLHAAHICQACFEKMIVDWKHDPQIRADFNKHTPLFKPATMSTEANEQIFKAKYEPIDGSAEEEFEYMQESARSSIEWIMSWGGEALKRLENFGKEDKG